jgi:hypothetical protein
MARLIGPLILIACLLVKCAVELTEPEKTLQRLSRKRPHQDFRTCGPSAYLAAGAAGST